VTLYEGHDACAVRLSGRFSFSMAQYGAICSLGGSFADEDHMDFRPIAPTRSASFRDTRHRNSA